MSKNAGKTAAAAALNIIQKDSYLAWIEWPVLLFLQLREVEKHLTVVATSNTSAAKGQTETAPHQPAQSRAPAPQKRAIIARSQPTSSGQRFTQDQASKSATNTDAAVADLLESFKMEE